MCSHLNLSSSAEASEYIVCGVGTRATLREGTSMVRASSLSRGAALALLTLLAVGGGLPAQTIIDNSSATGFSATAGWTQFTGQGYQNNIAFAPSGSGDQIATYTFTGLTAGVYRVSATWT